MAVEASNLYSLLTNLPFRVEEAQSVDPWFNQVKLVVVENGPLDQFKGTLEKMVESISSTRKRDQIKSALTWTFTKLEVDNALERVERLKSPDSAKSNILDVKRRPACVLSAERLLAIKDGPSPQRTLVSLEIEFMTKKRKAEDDPKGKGKARDDDSGKENKKRPKKPKKGHRDPDEQIWDQSLVDGVT